MIKLTLGISKLDSKILKLLKNKPLGLSLFDICEKLNLDTYEYNHLCFLPSGIYEQLLIQHYKQSTIYRYLQRLYKLRLINYYHLIGNVGRPTNYYYLVDST